jgi:hypothetical protein
MWPVADGAQGQDCCREQAGGRQDFLSFARSRRATLAGPRMAQTGEQGAAGASCSWEPLSFAPSFLAEPKLSASPRAQESELGATEIEASGVVVRIPPDKPGSSAPSPNRMCPIAQ